MYTETISPPSTSNVLNVEYWSKEIASRNLSRTLPGRCVTNALKTDIASIAGLRMKFIKLAKLTAEYAEPL